MPPGSRHFSGLVEPDAAQTRRARTRDHRGDARAPRSRQGSRRCCGRTHKAAGRGERRGFLGLKRLLYWTANQFGTDGPEARALSGRPLPMCRPPSNRKGYGSNNDRNGWEGKCESERKFRHGFFHDHFSDSAGSAGTSKILSHVKRQYGLLQAHPARVGEGSPLALAERRREDQDHVVVPAKENSDATRSSSALRSTPSACDCTVRPRSRTL
jgi:hypothetical protein